VVARLLRSFLAARAPSQDVERVAADFLHWSRCQTARSRDWFGVCDDRVHPDVASYFTVDLRTNLVDDYDRHDVLGCKYEFGLERDGVLIETTGLDTNNPKLAARWFYQEFGYEPTPGDRIVLLTTE
jgi:hypothetical protein